MDIPALLRLAREAGDAILSVYDRGGAVETKADGSPLTEADRLSHDLIAEGLRRLFPDIPVISEEGKDVSYEERKSWERFWLVDPLDGTKEFLKHNGEFTVNIALIEGSQPVLGVIYAPALEELYYGDTRSGAFKQAGGDGQPERAIGVHPAGGEGALRVVGSRSHSAAEEKEFLSQFSVAETLAVGSSLKFCFVSEGKADLYYRHGHTWEWDTAAGHALARAAGAQVYGLTYNKENLLNDGFLVSAFPFDSAVHALPPGIEG